jgi:hypothetical protein
MVFPPSSSKVRDNAAARANHGKPSTGKKQGGSGAFSEPDSAKAVSAVDVSHAAGVAVAAAGGKPSRASAAGVTVGATGSPAGAATVFPPRVELASAVEIMRAQKRVLSQAATKTKDKSANAEARAAEVRTQGTPRGLQPATRTQSESILLGNLNTDLGDIYQKTVAAFAPAFRHLPSPVVLRSPDNAVLMFRVNNRRDAKQLWKRLEKCVVYGRKWRATYAPLSSVTPTTSPTPVNVLMSSPPLELHQVEAVLGTLPGVLAVSPGDSANEFLATFADEGSALHARAVLSGRRQEGCHLFLSIRRDVGAMSSDEDGNDDDEAIAA